METDYEESLKYNDSFISAITETFANEMTRYIPMVITEASRLPKHGYNMSSNQNARLAPRSVIKSSLRQQREFDKNKMSMGNDPQEQLSSSASPKPDPESKPKLIEHKKNYDHLIPFLKPKLTEGGKNYNYNHAFLKPEPGKSSKPKLIEQRKNYYDLIPFLKPELIEQRKNYNDASPKPEPGKSSKPKLIEHKKNYYDLIPFLKPEPGKSSKLRLMDRIKNWKGWKTPGNIYKAIKSGFNRAKDYVKEKSQIIGNRALSGIIRSAATGKKFIPKHIRNTEIVRARNKRAQAKSKK